MSGQATMNGAAMNGAAMNGATMDDFGRLDIRAGAVVLVRPDLAVPNGGRLF